MHCPSVSQALPEVVHLTTSLSGSRFSDASAAVSRGGQFLASNFLYPQISGENNKEGKKGKFPSTAADIAKLIIAGCLIRTEPVARAPGPRGRLMELKGSWWIGCLSPWPVVGNKWTPLLPIRPFNSDGAVVWCWEQIDSNFHHLIILFKI